MSDEEAVVEGPSMPTAEQLLQRDADGEKRKHRHHHSHRSDRDRSDRGSGSRRDDDAGERKHPTMHKHDEKQDAAAPPKSRADSGLSWMVAAACIPLMLHHTCAGCRAGSICLARAEAGGRSRCRRRRCCCCAPECGGPTQESHGLGRHRRAEGDCCRHGTEYVSIGCVNAFSELACRSGTRFETHVHTLSRCTRHFPPGATPQGQWPVGLGNSSRGRYPYCRAEARCERNQDRTRLSRRR